VEKLQAKNSHLGGLPKVFFNSRLSVKGEKKKNSNEQERRKVESKRIPMGDQATMYPPNKAEGGGGTKHHKITPNVRRSIGNAESNLINKRLCPQKSWRGEEKTEKQRAEFRWNRCNYRMGTLTDINLMVTSALSREKKTNSGIYSAD